MTIRTILMIALGLTAVGCAPIPHAERLVPRTAGTVVDGDMKPLGGVRVEYLFRGGRVLGETVTSSDGRFTLGPFSQWFYLVYMGSPGVAPFPYALERPPVLPDVIRVSADGATGIYLRGTEARFDGRSRRTFPGDIRQHVRWPSPRRWTGEEMTLILTPDMKDSSLPSLDIPAPANP